ncbi:hypothetical protein [uncultured Sphaerochaeta sp.]|uniref:hypothetical protein n=1 Tax=uncultured Sphaerochaeta sp. TaxID=886478 RepID=UPI002A0A4469|nr:hypothetical protein [uncultured Sphaerochaeta sp.]
MKHIRPSLILLFVLSFLFLYSGCAEYSSTESGRLAIHFSEPKAREIYLPSIPLDIASYKITLTSGSETKTYEVGKQDSLVIEGLLPGIWTIEVAGYNGWDASASQVSGQQVATLEKNQEGNRLVACSVKRGEVTSTSLAMVPFSEGTGTLTLTVNWPQENQGSSLILNNPILDVYIKGYNAHGSVYEDNSSYTKSLLMPGTVNFFTAILLNMPPGWYEIQTRLIPQNATGDATLFYRNLDFAQVVPNDTTGTIGVLDITDEMLVTGSIDWSFSEDMEQALENLSINQVRADEVDYAGVIQHFSCTYESPTASYQWYVDGVAVTGETNQTFSYNFSNHGLHRVMVAVQDGGVVNGEEIIMDIKPAYTVGNHGQAGGWVFYCDTEGLYEGWTYLEGAPEDLATPMAWSNITNVLVGTSRDIGSGEANTAAIIAQEGHTSSAALACTQSDYGNFTDWFLPSVDELEVFIANNTDFAKSVASAYHWSSTDRYTSFANISSSMLKTKNNEYEVRPIRSF